MKADCFSGLSRHALTPQTVRRNLAAQIRSLSGLFVVLPTSFEKSRREGLELHHTGGGGSWLAILELIDGSNRLSHFELGIKKMSQ